MSASYAGTGLEGIFSNIGNIYDYTSSFLSQTSAITSGSGTNSSDTSQLNSILSLLGLGTTSTSGTSTGTNQLSSILSLLGLGTTSTSGTDTVVDDWWNHTDDDDSSDDSFWDYIDSKVAQSSQQSSSIDINSILSLLTQLNGNVSA